MKDRVDKLLVKSGLIESRSQAKLLVKEGVVFYKNKLIKKSGELVELDGLELRKKNIYVGRGAHKLEFALDKFKVDVENKIGADIGASTGGFTDVLLSRGAKKVYAIDVGTAQLHQKLRDDTRVINLEQTNVRDISDLEELVDFCVVDLSYISIKLVMNKIFSFVKQDGEVIVLIKPQFEVGRDKIGKNGIVKSVEARSKILKDLYGWLTSNGFFVSNATQSPITGKSGNVEYLYNLSRDSANKITLEEIEKII